MSESGRNDCANCGHNLDAIALADGEPCPLCGSTSRNKIRVISEAILNFESISPSLKPYVDQSNKNTEQATLQSLRCIELWYAAADPLIARHVEDGNLKPTEAAIPQGPFSDKKIRKILKTIRTDRTEQKHSWWERDKTYILAFVGLVSAIVTLLVAFVN